MKPSGRTVTAAAVKKFRSEIYLYYRRSGRALPWRRTRDPYCILVSEIMLQQTQASRVVGKYQEFLKRFPTVRALAGAPLRDIFTVWQGLGYNRRAVYLQKTARAVIAQHGGKIPRKIELLRTLPGIGSYTAAAIAAFAFGQPTVCIETNIRTVFIHFFFRQKSAVSDAELLPLIAQTLEAGNPREWYWALMDYGAMLKREKGNAGAQSRHYIRQSKFEGSNRQVRGKILRSLLGRPQAARALAKGLGIEIDLAEKNLAILTTEGLLRKLGHKYAIND